MRAASNPAKLALNAAWTCTFNQIEYLDTTRCMASPSVCRRSTLSYSISLAKI